MTDHAEIIRNAVDDAHYGKGYVESSDILDALAAAGVLLTDPEKGHRIVEPARCTWCNGLGHAEEDPRVRCPHCKATGFHFDRARVLPCPTCENEGYVCEKCGMNQPGCANDMVPCPDCSDYTLGRLDTYTDIEGAVSILSVAPYRLPGGGADVIAVPDATQTVVEELREETEIQRRIRRDMTPRRAGPKEREA